ncbi:MAG: type II toxin-antitoxin system RelE/ParE family toxin [Alphaproteobacteria bacterium]|nr:type II toxin-antitoxin system RelE/ParE family toxin [Alphaproteobacteria bacterium]
MGLADQKAKARIVARLKSAMLGNLGDCKPVGSGVSEMRIHVGAGYRVYYMRQGKTIYVLLMGGNKATQKKDIELAVKMSQTYREDSL